MNCQQLNREIVTGDYYKQKNLKICITDI